MQYNTPGLMRLVLFMALAIGVGFPAFSQPNQCGTAERAVASPPSSSDRALMDQVRSYIASQPTSRSSDSVLIIPTVVHIIHWDVVGNITDEQVEDGLRVVNEDFRKQNADTMNTDSLFAPLAADIGIEFHLAQIDPDGNPTTGITRTDTSMIPHPEPTEPEFDNVKHLIAWPPEKYFNIWVVRSIMGGTSGYAQYPGTDFTYGGPWETYGVVIRSSELGTIGSSNADGRTLTHEIGHCLGLYHTFLSASTGCEMQCDTTGDEVCDTPPAQQNFGCSPNLNTCSNDTMGPSYWSSDVKDMKESYMSYNTCQSMFSLGQKQRMLGFFNAFDTLRNLASVENLVATGILTPPAGNDFYADIQQSAIHAYPNPSSSGWQIHGLKAAQFPIEVCIVDAVGNVKQRTVLYNAGDTVNAHGLPRGIYFLRLSHSNWHVTVKAIVQ